MVKWLIGLMVKNIRHKLENSSKDQMDTRLRLLEDLWSYETNVRWMHECT